MTVYNDQLSQYITNLYAKHDKPLSHAYEDTPKRGLPAISVKPEEGKFLQFLVKASNVKKALEIGTLGGYSGIWIARGLAPGGKLITVDKEPRHAAVARDHFMAAGLSDKIDQRVGDAPRVLKDVAKEAPFDFVFIDADKPGYPAYLDWALENTRLGGVIAAHNAFRKGSIVGLKEDDDYSEGMRAFNLRVANDPRLLSTIFPAGDGMLVMVKIA